MTFDLGTQMPRIGERAEVLVTWYLRFNGFFPLPNFILHDAGATKSPGQQLTEADVLAVRLPFTKEVIAAPDGAICTAVDPRLDIRPRVTELLIAEVSSEQCKFNWLDRSPRDQRLFFSYVLRRFGFWQDRELAAIASKLVARKFWERGTTRLRLLSFGIHLTSARRWPKRISQIPLEQTLRYLQQLFSCYGKRPAPKEKFVVSDHKQWHPMIKEIYDRLLGHKRQRREDVGEVLEWLFPGSR